MKKGGETSLLFERKREGAPQPKILCVQAKVLTENERTRELYITIIPNDEEKPNECRFANATLLGV